MIDDVVAMQAMTSLWGSSIDTLWFPEKNWRVHFRHRGWGRQRYLPPRLRGDMATPTTIALDSSFNLLLISRILVDNDGNCQHHVIIGINRGLSRRGAISRRGESTHSGVDVNNTQLSMINPLRKTLIWPDKYGKKLSILLLKCQAIMKYSNTVW